MPIIILEGERFGWVQSVKYLGTFWLPTCQRTQRYDINREILSQGQPAPSTNLDFLQRKWSWVSKCSHFYGCDWWDLTHAAVKRLGTTWYKAMRKVWRLSPNSHQAHMVDSYKGSHVLHITYRRFCKMINGMLTKEQNHTKCSFFYH